MVYESIDLSASQVETFRDCPRKWAWRKIDGIEEKEKNAAAELGTEVHLLLEKWQRDAEPFDVQSRAGKIALVMIRHLPPPKTDGIEVEAWFNFSFYNINMRGRIDWQHLFRAPYPKIGDHKTTSDFKWAKSERDLLHDIQASAYAFHAMQKTGLKTVDLQWTYGTTSGSPQARPVYAQIGAGQVNDVLGLVYEDGQKMLALKNAYAPGQTIHIPPDVSACDKYGGCPFRGLCNLSAQDRAKGIFSQMKNVALADQGKLREQENHSMGHAQDVLAKLKAQREAAAGGAAAPAAAAPAPAVNAGDPPPPPPAPIQVNGTWVMPVYDPNTGTWGFPGTVPAAAPAPAPAPAAALAAKTSLLNRVPKPKKPEAPPINLDAPAPAPAAAAPVPAPAGPAVGAPPPGVNGVAGLSESDREDIAGRVAAKILSKIASALHLANG